jgi:arylsulfatase A-like enzyme
MKSNVILIVLDTARQTTFRRLLNDGELPVLERIREEGIQFNSASANGAWTLPTHASMFTGKRISRHGTHAGTKSFDPEGRTLAEILSSDGYKTLGISGNAWISPDVGFDRGFDTLSMKWDYFWNSADLTGISAACGIREKIENLVDRIEFSNAPTTALNSLYANFLSNRHDDGARNITRRSTNWFRDRGRDDQPFFFFINYLEPHLEYDPVPKYRERFAPRIDENRIAGINQDPWEYIGGESELTDADFEILEALYEAEIAYLDEKIGELYDSLARAGLLEETGIIIVGDHGENIGDHGLMDHQYCLYETLLNVPLIVRPPGGDGGSTVEAPVETRDVFPTVLELADVDPPDGSEISYNALLASPGREYVIGEYRAPQPSMESIASMFGSVPEAMRAYDRALRSIRTDRWKLIEGSDGSVELYDLSSDPGETTDRSSERPGTVAELSARLDAEGVPKSPASRTDVEMAEASRERLEDLGYI